MPCRSQSLNNHMSTTRDSGREPWRELLRLRSGSLQRARCSRFQVLPEASCHWLIQSPGSNLLIFPNNQFEQPKITPSLWLPIHITETSVTPSASGWPTGGWTHALLSSRQGTLALLCNCRGLWWTALCLTLHREPIALENPTKGWSETIAPSIIGAPKPLLYSKVAVLRQASWKRSWIGKSACQSTLRFKRTHVLFVQVVEHWTSSTHLQECLRGREFVQPAQTCSVKLEKAYECILQGILWEVLWEYGVDGPLLLPMQSENIRARVYFAVLTVNQSHSQESLGSARAALCPLPLIDRITRCSQKAEGASLGGLKIP